MSAPGVSMATLEWNLGTSDIETNETQACGVSFDLSLFSRILDCTSDALSYTRHLLTATEIFRKGGALFTYTASLSKPLIAFGALSGALLMTSGTIGVGRSLYNAKADWERGDVEGAGLNLCLNTPIMSSITVIGGCMLVSKVATLQSALIGTALNVSSLVMPIFLGIYSLYGILSSQIFSNELNEVCSKEGRSPEALKNACVWLLEKTTLLEEEKKQCGVDLEASLLLQGKHASFARRTSGKCLQKILDADLKSLITDLEEGRGEERAIELLTSVYSENIKTKIRFAWLGLISVIAFAISLTGVFFTGGAVSLLFAAGAIFWISTDSPKFRKKMENFILERTKEFTFPSLLNETKSCPKDQAKFFAFVIAAAILAPIWVVPTAVYLEGASMVRKIERSQMFAAGYTLLSQDEKES
jgi:hypothetical protein